MAFQRPFLISLKRSDTQKPWGFRVFGGKDYGESHIVQKISPDSISEQSGLREGDEIIQIGRVNIQDLTFNQVQELIARCGNRLEMFIIREDLLTTKTGKEPPCIKAVVHNPYNSPLQLYSTENIADALAKQTEVLTEGKISAVEDEEGPENLSFKQKSAVFHLLEEQAKQENVPQAYPRGSPQRKVPPPPPPKPKPPAEFNNYEEPETRYSPQRHTTTAVITPTQKVQTSHPLSRETATISFKVTSKAYSSPPVDQYPTQPSTQQPSSAFKVTSKAYTSPVDQYPTQPSTQQPSSAFKVTSKAYSSPPADQYLTQRSTQQPSSTVKVGPPPPPRGSSQTTMTTVQRQQQQQYHYQTQYQQYQYPQQEQQSFYPQQQQHTDYQQQVRRQQDVYQSTPQYQQQAQYQPQYQPQQQQQYQQQQYQQPQDQPEETENIFQTVSNTPITYKAPPQQRYRVNWPPANDLRQMTPSPTPASPSKMYIESVWPPRQPTARELPRTGFNPAALREQGTGRKCVWPPPRPEDEMWSGRLTPQSPTGGRRVNWNPSPSPPTSRRLPFGSTSPQTRRKDISWPPPQPYSNKENLSRPSPRMSRKSGRFEDYVKQQASSNVPVTYRTPPGTQRVESS